MAVQFSPFAKKFKYTTVNVAYILVFWALTKQLGREGAEREKKNTKARKREVNQWRKERERESTLL